MPEGPEVQVMLDSLSVLRNIEIIGLETLASRTTPIKNDLSGTVGHCIVEFLRHGKFLDFLLDDGNHLLVHLGMTGHFRFDRPDKPLFVVRFKDGRNLYYSDPRNFSRVLLLNDRELCEYPAIRDLGPDAMTTGVKTIADRIRRLRDSGKNVEIKPALLDYRNIAGIGNIYASEVLFEAGIAPQRKFKSLTDEEIAKLAAAIHRILNVAYKSGGSTIESFEDVRGQKGDFQKSHKVYQRFVCQNCGGPIERIEQNGRSTFYCPAEQR